MGLLMIWDVWEVVAGLGRSTVGAAAEGGEMTLGKAPRLRNGMRNCGISSLFDDNRRRFRSCSGTEIVAVRRRLDLRAKPSLPDFGRSGGDSWLLGLLDLDDL